VKRVHQGILIAATLLLSWFGMMAVHEFGHVAGAWGTGGTVAQVVLHPLTISRTDLAHNPHPLAVVWAGPVVGALLPLLAWALAVALWWPGAYLLRFFAGFCLVANGAYIGVGSVEGIGDAGEMLRLGSPVWLLWGFGAVTAPAGLFLWHRLGEHFGLGAARGQVSRPAAYLCLLALVVLVSVEWFLGGE
jgi:hypothetical protein